MILTGRADAHVRQAAPAANFALNVRNWVNGSGSVGRRTFIWFPKQVPISSKVLTAKVRVYLRGSWSGTNTLTIKRVTQSFKEGTINWNNQPTVSATNSVQVVVTSGVDQQEVLFDVLNMMQDVANGSPFFGFRIEMAETADRALRSGEDPTSTLRPTLELEWSEAPEAPDRLSPDGGDAVSNSVPILDWRFSDKVGTGAGTLQSAFQIQVDDTFDMSSPIYDTGKILGSDSQFPLNENLIATKMASDFEGGITGITADTNVTNASSSTQARSGTSSLRMTATAAADMYSRLTHGSTVAPVTAGKVYSFQAWSRANSVARTARVRVRWLNSGGSEVGGSPTDGTGVANVTSGWTQHLHENVVAPTGAVEAAMGLYVVAPGAGEIHFTDDWMVNEGATALPFAPSFFDQMADGVTRYWRVRVWDGTDFVSDWSSIASMVRDNLGTLTLSSPGATVPETTPPISWSLSGETQAKWRVTLFEVATTGKLTQLWQVSGTGTQNTATPPAGLIVTGKTYRAQVESWDNKARVGDDHVTKTQDFTYVRDQTVGAVSTLTAVPTDGSPEVVLTWTRATQPDFFCLKVNGVEDDDNSRIVPADVFVSGTTYRMSYWASKPRTNVTYEMEAVVQSGGAGTPYRHSGPNPTATVKTNPVGIWLIDTDDNTAVQIVDKTKAEFGIGESGTTFDIIGARIPVRITDIIRGYEGPISGRLLGSQERADFLTLKGRDTSLRLVVGDLAFPIRMEEASVTPTVVPGDQIFDVAFSFFQVGRPWPTS